MQKTGNNAVVNKVVIKALLTNEMSKFAIKVDAKPSYSNRKICL